MQEKGEAFYFIADYHSMTSLFDAASGGKNTLDVALDFLACGLDPKKSVFFRQSDVPEVTELAWILTTLTPMSLLEKNSPYLRFRGKRHARAGFRLIHGGVSRRSV